jgi:hypothetical protein
MAEIVNITYTGDEIGSQEYNVKDNSLITNSFIYTKFGDPNDSIEYFIYDTTGTLLDSVYNASNYTPSPSVNPVTSLYSSITLDPKNDLAANGYERGALNIQYNFLRNLFNSSYGVFYWIKEISFSRTELKLSSQNLSNTQIISGFNQYQTYIAGLNYYPDFYLNFGRNQHIIATNVAYTEDDEGAYLLIKLYEPLPSNFDLKDRLWLVEKIARSANYDVDIQVETVVATQEFALRGPNYNVKLNERVGETTPYYSYTSLTNTPISSSFQKMMSYYQDRAVAINVDYSDFTNFIHFSSATSRINNFVSKLSDIERYNAQISQQLSLAGSSTSPAISSTVVNLRKSIDSITTNFDNYEYYLYYSSGSTAWPKSNSTQPYSLYSVTSSQAINWLGSETTLPTSTGLSILYSASFYDATNKDLLANIVPQFISDDANNEPYITFVNMIGQHFDNIWIYYKDVTNRFDATNNPATGISPDIVADALINLGTTLYTNTNLSDNLYYSLFGINEDGSLLPPTGSEKISTYVTSSLTTLPEANIKKEIYKRIYHNIPYLYKTKGTRASIEALVNIFGIPKSILTINEFGGYDRYLVDGVDEIFNTKVTGSTTVLEISASVLNPYTTLQYYNDDTRLNSRNLEFGFSPSDALNSTITSSLGYFNIDQLIGNPTDQYSNTYPALDQKSLQFFTPYNFYHNVYEYIRLLKYYDNSIFKMVQDYVPARANLSTGLIVKSHILERNKYERYEPEVEITNNYSESIELLTVSGTDPDEIPWSTANTTFSQFIAQPLSNNTGSDNVYIPVEVNNTYSWEKYTGEFGGSTLDVVTGDFSQIEASSMTNPGPHSGPIVFSRNCKSITVCNNSTSSFDIQYYDCTLGNIRIVTLGGQTCTFGCMDPDTLYIGAFSPSPPPPEDYSITDSGICQGPLMCNRYSFTLEGSPLAGASYSGSYRDCDGAQRQISLSIVADVEINVCSIDTEISIIKTPIVGFPSLSEYYPAGFCTYSVELPTVFYNDGATYNNVNKSVTSTRFTEAEYSYGIDIPDNMSNIISQSSCQNCNRIPCYNLNIFNESTSSQAFIYQDCGGESSVVTLEAYDIISVCAKSNTLNFLYEASASLVVGLGDQCGASFSNYPYTKNCGSVTVCNLSSSAFIMTYFDCNNIYREQTVLLGSCSFNNCMDGDTLGIQSGSLPVDPANYELIFNGYCNYPITSSFTKYCEFLGTIDIGPYSAYTYEYTTCTGIQESGSGVVDIPFSGSLQIGISKCIRSGSLVITGDTTGSIVTGSLSYCGFYEDPTPYTGSRIPVEIQEYNYNRTSTLNSKYAGAKNFSAKYNVYTPGDESYPGFAAADNYVGFTGLFTNVESSSYYPDQMNVKLTYLSDTSGGLNDLNLENNNWVYVQNMYKPNSIATIKQFNATQFSNQVYLDKQFKVVESGYSYQPYWYRLRADGQECYRSDFVGSSGSSQFGYSVFNRFTDDSGSVDHFLNDIYYPTHSATNRYSDWPYIPSGSSESDSPFTSNTYQLSLFNKKQNTGGSNLVSYYNYSSSWDPEHKYTTGSYYNVPEDGVYFLSSKFYSRILAETVVIFELPFPFGTTRRLRPASIPDDFSIDIYIIKNPSVTSGYIDGGTVLASGTYQFRPDSTTPNYYSTQASFTGFLEKDDRIYVKTVISNWTRYVPPVANWVPPYVSVSVAGMEYYLSYELVSAIGDYCVPTNSLPLFNSSSYVTGDKILPITRGMSVYFDTSGSTTFLPEPSSSLYPLLGDVNYSTEIEPGDFIIFYYSVSDVQLGGSGDLYPITRRVIDVRDNGTTKSIEVYPNMPLYITTDNINLYQKIAFIKKQPDESSVILKGRKRPGKTSFGFLTPQDVNPYILNNINTLQSTIQSQILDY